MAVRPLVTTGVALLSAGALVAGTPSLFVPHSEVTVAAPTAAAPAAKSTLTVDQITLLALTDLSLRGAWQSFTQGYGGYYIPGQVPTPAVGIVDPNDPNDSLVDANGTPLYKLDANGNPVRAVDGDQGPGVQFYTVNKQPVYELDENGDPVLQDDPGNCTATGAECLDGFTGLAYYLTDTVLPPGVGLDNIFFEGGFTSLAYEVTNTVALVIDAIDPTQRLQLSKRVTEFWDGGVTEVVGSILNDNLRDGSFAQGLSNSFFFGYGVNTGITAAVTYVVDAISQGTTDPDPNYINPLGPAENQVQTVDADTTLLASKTTDPGSTSLPAPGSLLKLPKFESPFKKLAEDFKAPAAPKLLKEVEVKDELDQTEVEGGTVEGGTVGTPVVNLPTKPEFPKFEAPKLPELPKVELPKLNLDLKPKVKPVVEEKESEETEKAVDTKDGNKATPILFGNGKPKGETNGKKFLKELKKAVDNATGGDTEKKDEGGGEK